MPVDKPWVKNNLWNPRVQVEVAFSLACIVLRNKLLQKELQESEGFKYADVLFLLHAQDKVIPLQNISDHHARDKVIPLQNISGQLEEGFETTSSNYYQVFFMAVFKRLTSEMENLSGRPLLCIGWMILSHISHSTLHFWNVAVLCVGSSQNKNKTTKKITQSLLFWMHQIFDPILWTFNPLWSAASAIF